MTDARTERFLRELREDTAFHSECDRPDYEAADRWWRRYHMDVVNFSPDDRERIEREIRRCTRT